MRFAVGGDDASRRVDDALRNWRDQAEAVGHPAELEGPSGPDEHGQHHWLLRLRGEERDVITLWFALRQRSVRVEAEVTPAPERSEAVYRYALARNREARTAWLALGPEDGLYLVSVVALEEFHYARLEELVAEFLVIVDEIYPTAMSLGMPWFRRRPGR